MDYLENLALSYGLSVYNLRFELRAVRVVEIAFFFLQICSARNEKDFFKCCLFCGCRLPSPGRGYTFLHLLNFETGLSVEGL